MAEPPTREKNKSASKGGRPKSQGTKQFEAKRTRGGILKKNGVWGLKSSKRKGVGQGKKKGGLNKHLPSEKKEGADRKRRTTLSKQVEERKKARQFDGGNPDRKGLLEALQKAG